jgi:capsular polysaccharide biosynthesis protein
LASFVGFPEERIRFDVRPKGERPRLVEHRDVLVVPGLDALYSKEGIRIDLSTRVTLPADMPAASSSAARVEAGYGKHTPLRVEVPKTLEVFEDSALYGGLSWPHFGHFLTDGMSRLWALDHVPQSLPVVYLDRAHPDFGSEPFSATVVRYLQLESRLIRFRRPTMVRRLFIPAPAIEHAFRIYFSQAAPHVRTATRVLKFRRSAFSGRPVYLSRSNLPSDLRRSAQERELEQKLAKIGMETLYPEQLSMEDQIDIFNNSPVVAGMIGSAFHTELFRLEGNTGKLVILGWEKINNRYRMIDAIKDSDVTYVNAAKLASIRDDQRILDVDLDVDLSFSVISETLKRT